MQQLKKLSASLHEEYQFRDHFRLDNCLYLHLRRILHFRLSPLGTGQWQTENKHLNSKRKIFKSDSILYK